MALLDETRWSRSDSIPRYLTTDVTGAEADALFPKGPARAALEAMLQERSRIDASIQGLLMFVMRDGYFSGLIELQMDGRVFVWRDMRPPEHQHEHDGPMRARRGRR